MIVDNLNDLKKILPKKGRILALDIGTKRIGIAITDDTQTIATPKKIIKRQSNIKDFTLLLSIIQENQIIAIVLGFPIKMDDSVELMANFVKKFAINFDDFLNKLQINIPLILFDERLTSFEARQFMNLYQKKFTNYDDISASYILENFINDLRQS